MNNKHHLSLLEREVKHVITETVDHARWIEFKDTFVR